MANNSSILKHFVRAKGLHKLFNLEGFPAKTSLLDSSKGNSIMFITCDVNDNASFGAKYANGTNWIWAQGTLFAAADTSAVITNTTAADGSITVGDDIELVLRKLIKQVGDAKSSGVTSITTSDDNLWIQVDLEPADGTGLVDISISHRDVARTDDTDSSTIGSNFAFTAILDVSSDQKGHVTGQTAKIYTIPVDKETAHKGADSSLITSGAVWKYVNSKIVGNVQYRGTVTSLAEVIAKNEAGYGDFVRAAAEFNFKQSGDVDTSVHTSDILILDSSAEDGYKTSTNWVVLHNEKDSWREIWVNDEKKIESTENTSLNFVSGTDINLAYTDGGKLTINTSIAIGTSTNAGKLYISDCILPETIDDGIDYTHLMFVDSSNSSTAMSTLSAWYLYQGILDDEDVFATFASDTSNKFTEVDTSISELRGLINGVDSSLVVSNTANGTTNAIATNGNVYINYVKAGVVTNSHRIYSDGSVSITATADGSIKIDASTYTHPTYNTTKTSGQDGLHFIQSITTENGHVTGYVDASVPYADVTTFGVVKFLDCSIADLSTNANNVSTAISANCVAELKDEMIKNEETVSSHINAIYDAIEWDFVNC